MTRREDRSPQQLWAVRQPSLFRFTPEQFVAETLISIDELDLWHRKGWLSFDPHTMVEYDQKERVELEFVKGLARSALSDAMIARILSSLERPYCYDPSTTFLSFVGTRWIGLPPDRDPANVTIAYLDELIETQDWDSLGTLQGKISQALEDAEETDE